MVVARLHLWVVRFVFVLGPSSSFGRLSSFVGGWRRLWAVGFVCGRSGSFFAGCGAERSWVVIGVGRRVMVVVGAVVGLWWWLKEGSGVTHCDIRITFKLAREIKHVISRDFLAACSKNPPSPAPVRAR
jgi:hypothetical protein